MFRLLFPGLPSCLPANRAFLCSARVSPQEARLLIVDTRFTQGRKTSAEASGRYQARSVWSRIDPHRTGAAVNDLPVNEYVSRVFVFVLVLFFLFLFF